MTAPIQKNPPTLRTFVFGLLSGVILFGFLYAGYTEIAPKLFGSRHGLLTISPVIDRVAPAVVNITVDGSIEPESAGSGVIVDANQGFVLTNHHVIKGSKTITVRLTDGNTYTAQLIGSDAPTDIALLQIPPENLTELSIGSSDSLKVGDYVLAIGNPFGLGQTVTSGIVSALGRSGITPDKYESFIQTDASINPGNSGGALINSRGELIGINTAIIAPGGGNVGIGFAVPSSMAKAVMVQLQRHGRVRRGRIGVGIQDMTPELARGMRIKQKTGALVSRVEKGTPADKAGLRTDDVIIKVDGVPVRDSNALRNLIGLREVGSELELLILRNAEPRKVKLRIGAPQQAQSGAPRTYPELTGAVLAELPQTALLANPEQKGVYVESVEAGSPAWTLGWRAEDIIISVNEVPVNSVAEFKDRVGATGGQLAIKILRGDQTLYFSLQ